MGEAVVKSPRPDGGTQKPLDHETVVTACLDHIDTYGVEHLTMRGLGVRLGVEAMSIYRYTPGRESLIDATVSYVLRGVYHEMTQRRWPSWSAYARHLAHTMRQVALQHPALFSRIASRHDHVGLLLPPLSDLPLAEDLLWTLRDHGMDDREASSVYRALSQFLLGHLLLEAAGRDTTRPGTPRIHLDVREVSPEVWRLRARMREVDEQLRFDSDLEALLRELEACVECSDG
jgi:TetR/AcrR family tetracycline transcriptional repressor